MEPLVNRSTHGHKSTVTLLLREPTALDSPPCNSLRTRPACGCGQYISVGLSGDGPVQYPSMHPLLSCSRGQLILSAQSYTETTPVIWHLSSPKTCSSPENYCGHYSMVCARVRGQMSAVVIYSGNFGHHSFIQIFGSKELYGRLLLTARHTRGQHSVAR